MPTITTEQDVIDPNTTTSPGVVAPHQNASFKHRHLLWIAAGSVAFMLLFPLFAVWVWSAPEAGMAHILGLVSFSWAALP